MTLNSFRTNILLLKGKKNACYVDLVNNKTVKLNVNGKLVHQDPQTHCIANEL